jgi:hypothetical protein
MRSSRAREAGAEVIQQGSQRGRIFRLWGLVEYLEPFRLKAIEESAATTRIVNWFQQHEEPPWTPSFRRRHKQFQSRDRRIAHTVYFGIHDYGVLMRALLAALHVEHRPPPNEGSLLISCLGAFSVSEEGLPDEQSLQLTTAPWLLGRAQAAGEFELRGWSEAFRGYHGACQGALRDIRFDIEENRTAGAERHTLTGEDIQGFALGVCERSGSGLAIGMPTRGGVRDFLAVSTFAAAARDDSDAILGSFYIRDLEMIYNGAGDVSEPLERYLAADEPTRTDVTDTDHVITASQPSLLLSGRWPSGSGMHQSLLQQVAINTILGETLPLFSVNGPPGTGKTTLLRDVFADIICRRATAMCAFDRPASAFTEVDRIPNDEEPNRPTIIYEPDASLIGFEMVVASSNNKAVENVSRELPLARAVHAEHDATYLHETASHVLGEPAWGLLSAVLGRRDNVVEFAERLLFADEENKGARLHSVLGKRSQNVWFHAREHLTKAQKALEAMVARRTEWSRTLENLGPARRNLAWAQQRADAAATALRLARAAVEHASRERDADEMQRQAEQLAFDSIEATRPHWILHVLGLIWVHPTLKAYRYEIAVAREALRSASQRAVRSFRAARDAELDEGRAAEALTDAQNQARQAATTVRAYEDHCAEAARELREAFPDDKWRLQKLRDRELTALWTDTALNRARTALLLAALRVHETFLGHANAQLNLAYGNIKAWKLDCQGRQQGLTDRGRAALWRTLFLVVPVVSTTFASVGSLFRRLPREFFGWVFVDEAGQAVPQSAVGLLWRARRAVVVGDPLQVPPVVTTPAELITALARHLQAPLPWAPLESASVQTIADRANPLGAYVDLQGGGQMWVGSPLHVHRRCEEPMFSISNRVAYGGAMVLATERRELQNIAELGPSRWIHHAGTVTKGKHFVDSQADSAVRLLGRYWRREVQEKQPKEPPLYVITPFRDIAKELSTVLRDRWNEWTSSRDAAATWTRNNVGTIHRFQGRETDAVILLLGCDDASRGAVRWASSTPNLLNVAASRAKSRLYIIGDQALWGVNPVFNIALDELDAFAKQSRSSSPATALD